MARRADASAFDPEDLAEETRFDDERPRVGAPRSQPRARVMPPHDPDAEALAIATRVVETVAVARSLARIVGDLARANASAATVVLRTYADRKLAEMIEEGEPVERARKVATAAAGAAKHAALLAVLRASAARSTTDERQTEDAGERLDRERA